MVKPTLPVDIYIRVSRVGKRGEKLISPDEQEQRARALAKDRGLQVGQVLPPDLDESGGKWERPGLQEGLRRVQARESGGVIVAWLDRLSRDSEHAQRLIKQIAESGGTIYAPDAPADWTTPEGELQVGILFTFAQYVRKRAAAGFERAKAQAVERGIPVNTRAAVGYRKRDGEGQDRRLEPDPAVAPVIRELFERRAAGEGPASLGAFLTAAGVTTSQGSLTWSKQAVYGLIRNHVYLGELSYGSDRRYINADAHEPIVDLATWTAAQHPTRRPIAASTTRHEFLLTGLVRCAGCRYSLQATTTSHGHRIYRCTRTHSGGVCESPARVRADLLEPVIVAEFWRLTADIEAQGHSDAVADLGPLEDALALSERRVMQAMTPDIQDAAGEGWAELIRERRAERDRAAAALGEARADVAPAGRLPDAQSLRAWWPRMTAEDRRGFLSDRFDTIAVRRDPRVAVAYPHGSAPADLPRRGFKASPELRPFDDAPADARMLSLEP